MGSRRRTRALLALLAGAVVAGACGRDAYSPESTSGSPSPTASSSIVSESSAAVALPQVASLDLPGITAPSATGSCLVASLALRGRSVIDPATVALAWNAAPLAVLATQTSGDGALLLLASLPAPVAGAGTLHATWTGAADALLGAVAVSGAGNCGSSGATIATGSSGTPAVTVPSATGHLSVAALVSNWSVESALGTDHWHRVAVSTTSSLATLVQSATHVLDATLTDSVTLPAPPQRGSALVFIGANRHAALMSVTGGGVTWTRAASSFINANEEIWFGQDANGTASGTITYAIGGATTGPARAWVGEWRGLGAFEAANAAAGNNNPAAPGSIAVASTSLVFIGCANDSSANNGGPTMGPWTPAGGTLAVSTVVAGSFYRYVAAAGSASPQFTINPNNSPWDSAIAAFHAGSTTTSYTASGMTSVAGGTANLHGWTTTSSGDWAAAGLDLAPLP